MLGRLLRWLRGPASRPTRPAAPSIPADAGSTPYRHPVDTPAAEATSRAEPRRTSWWPLRLVPAGVLAGLDVYGLRYTMGMIYLTTNDVVFVVGGRTYLLEHERCEPGEGEAARLFPHVPRDGAEATAVGDRRRLARVMVVETEQVPPTVREGEAIERLDEPAPSHTGRRVDLAPVLASEVVRVVAAGDRAALAAVLGLLDLLARFDGHSGGELEILPARGPVRDSSFVRVSLGACGDAVFGARLDAATRARVAAALAAGVVDDGAGGLRVHALIDKRESLSGASGYQARLCLARLAASPAGLEYEDEVLWTEYERGIEYS